MAKYKPEGKKQVPGSLPPNAYDRSTKPARCTFTKTPNYVLVTKTMTLPCGFYFGSSASFADLGAAGKSATGHYDTDWGLLTVGTRLDIHPTAWTGSADDDGNIRFVYKSGLSTGGR